MFDQKSAVNIYVQRPDSQLWPFDSTSSIRDAGVHINHEDLTWSKIFD